MSGRWRTHAADDGIDTDDDLDMLDHGQPDERTLQDQLSAATSVASDEAPLFLATLSHTVAR